MAGKDVAVKKYVVRLSAEQREQLQTLIRKGKSPANRLLKARILLKADVSDAGEGWRDSRILEAFSSRTARQLHGQLRQGSIIDGSIRDLGGEVGRPSRVAPASTLQSLASEASHLAQTGKAQLLLENRKANTGFCWNIEARHDALPE